MRGAEDSLGPLILVFLSTVQKARRDKLSGIYRYGQKHCWRIQVIEDHPFAPPLPESLALWHPDGIIADGAIGLPGVTGRLFRGIPHVFLDKPNCKSRSQTFCVNHDSTQTARLATQMLLKLNLASYGFVGSAPDVFWSRERERAFVDAVRKADGLCSVYRTVNPCDWKKEQVRLREWLLAQPRPCGIFAAMDIRAKQVLETCRLASISVPEEMAVIGVDNDEPLCESTMPTLSSVLPDFEGAGYQAARLLDRLLTTPNLAPVQENYGPLRVALRQSTRHFPVGDTLISKAVEFIRLNAHLGICVQSVVEAIGVSRRLAEERFRKITGHSILDEIQSVRFSAVCELLQHTCKPISLIAQSCGYASDIYLKILFKKRMGLSMRDWRKRYSHVRTARQDG